MPQSQIANRKSQIERSSVVYSRSDFLEAGHLTSFGGRTEWVAMQVDVEERGKTFFAVLLRHGHERAQIANLVVLEEQRIQAGQALQRRQVGDGIVVEGKHG